MVWWFLKSIDMQTFRSFSFGSERGCLQAEIHALFGNITTKALAQFILVTSRATAHITKSLKAQGVFNDLPYSLLLASYRISSYKVSAITKVYWNDFILKLKACFYSNVLSTSALAFIWCEVCLRFSLAPYCCKNRLPQRPAVTAMWIQWIYIAVKLGLWGLPVFTAIWKLFVLDHKFHNF